MRNKQEFIVLSILGAVAAVGVFIMLSSAGTVDASGSAYRQTQSTLASKSTLMTQPLMTEPTFMWLLSAEKYEVYGRNVMLEYVDGDIAVLDLNGILLKVPTNDVITYKGLEIYSYGGSVVEYSSEGSYVDLFIRPYNSNVDMTQKLRLSYGKPESIFGKSIELVGINDDALTFVIKVDETLKSVQIGEEGTIGGLTMIGYDYYLQPIEPYYIASFEFSQRQK